MVEEPQVVAKKPVPATPLLQPTFPKFASAAGSCCFISIRIVNSRHVKDKCNCRSFIQQTRLEDQEFSSSWSSLDRYFCSCGHHAQYHPPGNSANNTTECDMEDQPTKQEEEEEEVSIPCPRPLTPVPQQEAENNRHIWHLYQKTAKLEQEISQKPNPDDVKTSVGHIVGNLEDRILELEERLEDTEIRLEEEARKSKSLQEEVDELIDENDDLRRGLSPVERASTDELEKLWREESERRKSAEQSLHEALISLKPVSKHNPWRVFVKLLLDPEQKSPVPIDSDEYARCDHLGCYQYIIVDGAGSRNFQAALLSRFPSSLFAKRWMPLIASRNEDDQIELERATDVEQLPSLWSVDFLRNTCALTVDGHDILYIAPQEGPLALDELESPRESPGLTEASTVSSTSLRRSSRKRSITNNPKIEAPIVLKKMRVKS